MLVHNGLTISIERPTKALLLPLGDNLWLVVLSIGHVSHVATHIVGNLLHCVGVALDVFVLLQRRLSRGLFQNLSALIVNTLVFIL